MSGLSNAFPGAQAKITDVSEAARLAGHNQTAPVATTQELAQLVADLQRRVAILEANRVLDEERLAK